MTGASSGLGYEVARILCESGNDVIFACRNEEKANRAIEKIKKQKADALATFMQVCRKFTGQLITAIDMVLLSAIDVALLYAVDIVLLISTIDIVIVPAIDIILSLIICHRCCPGICHRYCLIMWHKNCTTHVPKCEALTLGRDLRFGAVVQNSATSPFRCQTD